MEKTQAQGVLLLLLCVVSTCWGQQGNPALHFYSVLILQCIDLLPYCFSD